MPFGRALVVASVSGVAVGVITPVEAMAALSAAIASAAVLVALDDRAHRRAVVIALALALATTHGARARDRALTTPLGVWFDQAAGDDDRPGAPVVITGTLAADAAPAEGGARLVIDVRAIEDADGATRALSGRVQAHVAGQFAAASLDQWRGGRAVRAPVALRRPQVWLNPGGASATWQALRRPFHLSGSIKSATLVEVTRGPWWHEAAAAVRAHVRRVSAQVVGPFDPQSAAVVTAILIGDRAGLDEDVERRLQVAGTYHVIAISGGNVALVTALVVALARGLVRSFRLSSMTALIVVSLYGWTVGAQPSVARAVVVACVYLGVSLIGLAPPAANVLAVAAVLLLAIDPLMVVDIGAWLSFGATIGIIASATRLVAWARGNRAQPRSRAARLGWSALALLAATLAAELMLLPIGVAVFTRVSVAGLILNFIAIPAMAVVQIAGALAIALAAVSSAAASSAGFVAHLAASALTGSARLVDVVPWLSWRVPPSAPIWTVLFYVSCALVARGSRDQRRRFVAIATAVTAAMVIATAPLTPLAKPARGQLRLTMIDVGQGDAALVQFPTGHAMLIDAGGVPGVFDIGDRIVAPAIWALGVRRLDWLAVTHADRDHIGGALSVAAVLAPREVWEGAPVPPNAERRALAEDTRARGAAWRQIQAGHALQLGGVDVHVLHPPIPDWERQRVRNDDSIVFRIRYGLVELLLTGDIGEAIERGLPNDDGPPIRILKVAHHGSRTSTSPGFVRAYAPQIALVSAGRGNLFGHPAPDVVSRLERVGARVFRTDRDGAISVETDGRVARLRTIGGRVWEVRASHWPS